MDWHTFPWGAMVTGLLAIIGFIGWLVRLEVGGRQNSKDIDRENKDTDARFNVVNGAFTLVQGDIRELQIRTVNKDDLKETKDDLKESIREVGDRTDAAVERLITVFNKKSPAPRATKPRQ